MPPCVPSRDLRPLSEPPRRQRRQGFRPLRGNGASTHLVYHMVVARREVLVQLDDDMVRQLDELAHRLGTNRSELLRRGAQAVLAAEDERAADLELVAAYRRQPPDPALVQSARRLAARTTPAW